MAEKEIRLTAYTAGAGCAAKTAAGDLREMIAVLKSRCPAADANLLVGLEKPDDAAVYRIGLKAGDRLFLSKPLGTGVITTAAKEGAAPEDVLAGAVASMLRLNRVAAEVARDVGAVAVTDITGFGLLGHAAEMVQASAAGIALEASRLPLLPGARALARNRHFSGAMKRNRRHVEAVFGPRLRIHPDVPGPLGALLFESETSGALLFSVAADRAPEVVPRFARHGARCREIGIVVAAPTITVTP
jgi:selenide,water dikinase